MSQIKLSMWDRKWSLMGLMLWHHHSRVANTRRNTYTGPDDVMLKARAPILRSRCISVALPASVSVKLWPSVASLTRLRLLSPLLSSELWISSRPARFALPPPGDPRLHKFQPVVRMPLRLCWLPIATWSLKKPCIHMCVRARARARARASARVLIRFSAVLVTRIH